MHNEKWIYFFDLDGTLYKSNCSFRFGAFLYKKKYLSFLKSLKLCLSFFGHKLGLISISRLHQISFKALFLGRKKNIYDKLANRFVAFNQNSYFDFTLKKFMKAKSEGHVVVILSSSPDFLVKAFGEILGADKAFGCNYLTSETGHFSNIGSILNGKEKANLIHEICALYKIPKERTMAISDSLLDLDFLKAANAAAVVFPCRQLKKYALKYGWTILN